MSRHDSAPVVVTVVQETSENQSADAAETPAGRRPLLVYDGDCGFCGYWARYWQKLTGDRVEYRPYQEVAAQYPAISPADFQRAVQFIAPRECKRNVANFSSDRRCPRRRCVSSIISSMSSASSGRSWVMSQRGDSGIHERITRMKSPSTEPKKKEARQPRSGGRNAGLSSTIETAAPSAAPIQKLPLIMRSISRDNVQARTPEWSRQWPCIRRQCRPR